MDAKRLKPLLSALDGGYRHRPHEMLRWFLSSTMALWGLPEWDAPPDDAKGQIVEAIEAYSDITKGSEPFEDVLGPVYMDLASHGGRQSLGQFFTPGHIAKMMAAISSGDQPPSKERPGDLVRVCDPCCGSGVMMLAYANQVLRQFGPGELKHLSLLGADLDAICSRMFAVQAMSNCSVHGLELGELVVLHGNSLLPFDTLDLVLHASAPGVECEPALAPERLAGLAAAARSHPDVVDQLPLFEEAA